MADAPAGDGTGTANGTTGAVKPDEMPFSLGTGHSNSLFGFGAVFGAADTVVRAVQTNASASELVSAFGSKNVQVELDTLTAFTKKIEALLQAMEGSAAAPYNLQEQRLQADNFGKNFSQSTDLTTAYQRAHNELVNMHKVFVKQIEEMQKSVTKAAANYAGNEENTAAAQQAVAKNAGVATPAAGPNGPGPKVGF
ncbi:hypothetical protein OG535_23285 [Kitasatospora sp. NBC_00085]|uniref:hypothetical protein n=1 Tax=unclassified Kitasatospora TaxID=2633591 RepID=UPI0032507500